MTRRRASTMLKTLIVGAVFLGVGLFPINAASAKSGPDWSTGGSGWTGSGTVFLPGGRHVGPSSGSPDCPGCSWELIPICELDGPKSCASLHGCLPGRPFVIVTVYAPDADPNYVGGQCMNSDPVSTEDVGQVVAERVRQQAPPARPAFQPRAAALTALPTIFMSGQPRSISRSESIVGIPVDFSARARWRWTWGDGTPTLSTAKTGGAWPNMSLTHTFRRPGVRDVRVVTQWDAEYTVNGVGPFTVSGGPVVQTTRLRVPVKEARAVLIGANLG